jgi:hypothetical protein
MFKQKTIVIFGTLLLVVFLAGCSEESSNPAETSLTATDNYDNMDFSLPFGGLTVSDESEAFDDDALKAMMYAEEGEEYADEFAGDSDVLELQDQGNRPGDPNDPTRPRFTFLRLRWGMVRGPEDSLTAPEPPCDGLDWTGEMHTDRGVVLVRRVIRFERPGDHLIRPRLDRHTVAFVSRTGCHFDGLLIQIIEPPQANLPENSEPNRLHINTGPFSGVYEVRALAGLNEVHEVDENGNLIQLNGFNLSDTGYCPKGFLSGRFRHFSDEDQEVALSEDLAGAQLGRLAGLYMDLSGRITGFLRGGYGFNDEGNRVFFAKYIDRRGQFRGRLAGSWEPGENGPDLRHFEGRWISASGNAEGLFGGRGHGVSGYPGGFFEGRWTTICDDEAEEQIQ